MSVIGICRFSLVGRGDWKAFQGKDAEEAKKVAAEQAKALFDPKRMEARLKTFQHLTLSSLRAQTDQDFQFIVLASKMMPKQYQDRLKALCDDIPQVVLRFFPIIATHFAQKHVFRELGLTFNDILQFRLDDDDCLCSDFIRLMKEHTAEHMRSEPVFVASVRDVMYSSIGGEHGGIYHWPVEFMSAGAAIRHPSKSIYQFGHFRMATRFPKVVIPGHLSLVTNDGKNDTRFTPEMIARRRMKKMSEAEVQSAISRDFSFLTDEAKTLAGIVTEQRQEPVRQGSNPPMPQWFADLVTSSHHKGFYISESQFSLQHTFRGNQVLYVSFDNLSSVRSNDRGRDPWGYGFAAREGWSALGVLCYHANWFRIPQLYEEMRKLADQGFFKRFRKVIFSGTSMGAYAACAFSSLSPGSSVIAFSPQSSLSSEIADWDRRYPSGRAADWSGPFSDAADELQNAGKAWIIYDPRIKEDQRHAARLQGPNVTLLKARYSGHFTAQFISQIGMLGTLTRDCAADRMSEAGFYQLYRSGRTYRRYLQGLVNSAIADGSPYVQRRLAENLRSLNRLGLANDVEKSINATAGRVATQ